MAQNELINVKKQLGAVAKKSEAAEQAAKTAVAKAEAHCELRVSELRELLGRARAEVIEAEEQAAQAEARAAAAEARTVAAEAEAMAEALSQGMRAPSPPPQAHSEVPAMAQRIVKWEPFSEPSTEC